MRCTMSSSLLATVCWSRDEDGIGWSKLSPESALECPYVYHATLLSSSKFPLVIDTAAEKEFDTAI